MNPTFEACFLPIGAPPAGQRLAIHHPPQGGRARGCVVYVHPFAEEMNKSRRMAALQSRALAAQGLAVLQIDLLGCGDSDGDFADATWACWIDDVVCACQWLQGRHADGESPAPPLWLWGLRAGCLLAVDAAARLPGPCHFLFWQPPPTGKVLLHQFLRLKAASELMAGQAKAAMDVLRAEVAAGRSVEIAGYTLSAALCRGLENAALTPPPEPGRVLWLETSAAENATLSPAGTGAMNAWRAARWQVQAQCVRGAAFWQTTEIEDAPALLEATGAAVAAALRDPSPQAAEVVQA